MRWLRRTSNMGSVLSSCGISRYYHK